MPHNNRKEIPAEDIRAQEIEFMMNINAAAISYMHIATGKASNITIATHTHPDGDAVGSSLGLLHYLEAAGKNVRIVLSDGCPDSLGFLTEKAGGSISVLEENGDMTRRIIRESDLLFCLDMNSFSRAEALESGFEAFYAAVDDDILLQKEVIQAQRLVGLSRSMIKDTRSRIELIGKMLGIKKSELQQMEQQCHTDMANIDLRLRKSTEGLETLSRRLCREARGWMDIFLSRMKQELTALGSSQPTSILQKHLQFYLSDHIRQAILACLGAHRPQMEKCLREYAQGFSQESLRGIGEGQLQDVSIQLADISWTSVDTAAFAINTGSELLFGTESQMHGIISGISTLVGGFWRESKMKTRQQDILQPLLEKFPDISEDVFAQLENAYAQMSKAACNRLAEMFRSQMDISLEALEQAQKVLQNEDLREEELKEQLSVTGEILDRAERLLDSTGIGADPAGREEAL